MQKLADHFCLRVWPEQTLSSIFIRAAVSLVSKGYSFTVDSKSPFRPIPFEGGPAE